MIKTALLLSLPFFSQLFLWTGIYIPETKPWELREGSQLELRNDHSFTYNYRTSFSCWAWYDVHGNWEAKHDTLILENKVRVCYDISCDSLAVVKRFYLVKSLPITIQGELQSRLIFLPIYDRDYNDALSGESWGNFKLLN